MPERCAIRDSSTPFGRNALRRKCYRIAQLRHKPQPIDLEFMQWLGENTIPFSIIFTKADKLKPKAIENHIEDYKTILLETWEEMPNYFVTSASKKIGKDALLEYIDSINKEINQNKN